MRKQLAFILLLISSIATYAQTDGISYQAVIIDPNPKEIPGVDLQGNILPNAEVTIRFTILDQNNSTEYQEVQTTQTDDYGMINVMIGQGDPTGVGVGEFTLIDWDGLPRSLQVDIDFNGTGTSFVDLNRQELTFVPYAFHRNITASGDMTVDGTTDLNGVLTVQGPVDLNNSLDVTNGNPTVLSGSLTVDSATYLGDQLTVLGMTNLNDSVYINNQRPSYFTGNITVDGTSTFNGAAKFNSPVDFNEITVNGPSNLNGQVTVRANMDTVGNQSQYQAYPLLVEGSKQGIAIKVNENRSIGNNYVSFWDNEQMWGRIEGITLSEQSADPEYQLELGVRISDVIINGIEALIAIFENGQAVIKLTAAGTSSTACAGLGACVTAPIPSLIAESSSNLVLKIANVAAIGGNLALAITEEEGFRQLSIANIGVSYQSGAGDYAEWLPKENSSDTFLPGELVGVKNGLVTKNTWGVEKIMIVSTRPIVLGNMPEMEDEDDYVKIAFMGQVPAKVIGSVQPGDYVLPSEIGSGFAKAVNPNNMKTRDYKKIAGVAWSVTPLSMENVNLVNVAVGINTNDLSDVVQKQEDELLALRAEHNELKQNTAAANAALAKLVPGFADAIGYIEQPLSTQEQTLSKASQSQSVASIQPDHFNEDQYLEHSENDIIYFNISREQVEAAIDMSREQYKEMLNDSQTKKLLFSNTSGVHAKLEKTSGEKSTNQLLSATSSAETFLEKQMLIPLDKHPFWARMDSDPEYKEEIIQYVMSKFEKAIHTHKKYEHNFTDMEITD